MKPKFIGVYKNSKRARIDFRGIMDGVQNVDIAVRVREVVQAGDVFLLIFDCVLCGEPNMQGYPIGHCNVCLRDLKLFGFTLPTHRKDFRLLAGTKRKITFRKSTIKNLIQLQDNKCAYCDCELEANLNVEHIMPLSVGGTNGIHNLCLSCKRCNSVASSKYFYSFMDKRNYIVERRKIIG